MGEYLETQHRLFLQAMMWKKILPNDEVRLLHEKCHNSLDIPKADLKVFIEKINSALVNLNMALRKGVDEETGVDYLVLVNMAVSNISKASVEFKEKELEIFKKIVKVLITSKNGKAPIAKVLNFTDDLKIQYKMSKSEVQDVVQKFIESGWLKEVDQNIYFSTRAIVEFKHFFLENYPDHMKNCFLCKNIALQGSYCHSCKTKFHKPCKDNYFARVGSGECPACRKTYESSEDDDSSEEE